MEILKKPTDDLRIQANPAGVSCDSISYIGPATFCDK